LVKFFLPAQYLEGFVGEARNGKENVAKRER